MRLTRFVPAVAIALAGAIVPAAAQSDAATFPNRAIRLIVPFPPGGPDLPPLKWSSLKYVLTVEDRINGEEEAYG